VSLLAKSRAFFARDLSECMNRLAMALIAYLVLGVLAYTTLNDSRIRLLTLLILALFAFKTWVRRKEVIHPDGESDSE
jgi:hypothetical protein